MEFVSAYIFLLKMRFEDNLSFDIRIDKQYDDHRLPPMAVQMLIENAVKHNEISDRRPLSIRVYTEGEELVVTNPVQPKLTATAERVSGWLIWQNAIICFINVKYKSQKINTLRFVFH